jgi:periplasmic copper chaperone A
MKTSKLLTCGLTVGFLLAGQSASKAHIIIEDMQGRAGYNEMLTLIVPHGCGADPTTAVRMKVPEEITLVVPHPGDGWDVEIKKRKTDKPVMREGRPISEVVDEIVWSGNTLPSEELGLFKFMAGLPRTPGKVLYFKTIQVCGDKEDRWVETHDNDEEYWRVWLLKAPAPFAVIVETDKPQLGVDMQTLAKARAEMSGGQ